MDLKKSLFRTTILGVGFFMALPAAAQSTDETEELTPIIVTATRSAKAIDKIPGAVTVISPKELQAQFQVSDDPSAMLAATVPGFSPGRQKLTSAGESIRGRGALIMLDGIPQGNPLRDGRREGYFLDNAIVERVEVISGASAIHGMGATGGIVNYITRNAKQEGTHHKLDARVMSQFKSDSLDAKTSYTLSHKSDMLDMVAFAGIQRRGLMYDGRGKSIGVDSVAGDTADSHGNNLYLKVGKDIGDQRFQASINRFRLYGEGDYVEKTGNARLGIPTESEKGGYDEGVAPRNKIQSMNFDYSNADILGGSVSLQVFHHDADVLYGPDAAIAAQDRNIKPVGTLVDQSQLIDKKLGAKLTYVRPDLFIEGLELTLGGDQLWDKTTQRYALTNRTWMPWLKYRSTAGFTQLEYDIDDFTFRGGVRGEWARMKVDDFITLGYYGRLNNNWRGHLVQGGERSFSKAVKNAGVVWRFMPEWSAFAAYSEGFGLPDVGIALRAIAVPGQSVERLVDLQPVVTKSKEIGINWRAHWGNIGFSYYDSRSPMGSTIRVGTDGLGTILRVPTRVKGIEVTGEVHATDSLTLNANYSRTRGKTAEAVGRPLDLSLGGRNQGPDKVTAGANWRIDHAFSLRVHGTRLFDRDINPGRGTITNGHPVLQEHFDGYTTFDATLTWDSGDYGRFTFAMENLFDKQYITYYAQTQRYVAATADDQYFAGHGRTFSLGWTLEF